MMMLSHTQHSRWRAAQRAISSEIINIAFSHGDCLDLPGGASRIYCPKKSISKLKDENLITPQQAEKLETAYLVVSDDGSLITTGHLTKASKRANWKYV